jgi:hypothetical protein
MRSSIARLVALGRLPEEAEAEGAQLQDFESALKEIETPVSNEEAIALLSVFPNGEGSSFGAAWSILRV